MPALSRRPAAMMAGAMAAGLVLGLLAPHLAQRMAPIGTVFVGIIKLLVGPIIFFTVVCGCARIGSVRRVGTAGIKALLYFEAVSALALLLGLAAAHALAPGAGLRMASFDMARAVAPGWSDTLAGALLHSPFLLVLACALAGGAGVSLLGQRGLPLIALCEWSAGALFTLLRRVLCAAPLAAFAALALTVGTHGAGAIAPLLKLVAALYAASLFFVVVVLGALARASGVRLLRLLGYIKEELLLVFATASSSVAMPQLIEKMVRAGCPRAIAGLVIPLGYSFNLNGSNIYLTLALGFLAQACAIELSLGQQVSILAVAMITSKGASGVAGSAYMALAATLIAVPQIPDASLVLLIGIERLLKCRSLTNLIGNSVACLAISAWVGQLERQALRGALANTGALPP